MTTPYPVDLSDAVSRLDPHHQRLLAWRVDWLKRQHPHQIEPDWEAYDTWVLQAGRGAGKTEAASRAIAWHSLTQPNLRVLAIAPTSSDVRATIFEGESGLLRVLPQWAVQSYNKSTFELILINGSTIRGVSGDSPERLRGGNYHVMWVDEIAAMPYASEVWSLARLSVRLGDRTKALVTTTPKPVAILRDLTRREGKDVWFTRASSYANIDNLAGNFKAELLQYAGTAIGRQEIDGELLDLEDAGILPRSWFKLWDVSQGTPYFEHILISMDTAFSEESHKNADNTACQVWGVFTDPETNIPGMLLLECSSEKIGFPALRERAKELWEGQYGTKEQYPNTVLIEDKGSGISLRQSLQSDGIPVHAYNPGRADKIQRAHAASPLLKAGCIYLPESQRNPGQPISWCESFLEEVTMFPAPGFLRDQVDAFTQAANYLRDAGYISALLDVYRPDHADKDDETYWAKQRVKAGNPYTL